MIIIVIALNTVETKCLEIKSNRGMVANEHMRIDSNSYEKVKIFRLFSDNSKFYSG